MLMIHNAWTYGYGNAEEFRKQAEDLDKITQASVNAYMSRVSITEDELKEKMNAETWLTAEEALSDGFATKILEEDETGINQSAFRAIREKLLSTTIEAREGATLETAIELNADKLAEKVAEKIKPLLEKTGQQAQKKEMSTGWGAFFNGKGEKE